MFKQIIKIIWKQRHANGWIFAEILVVMGVLWIMMDILLVDTYTSRLPLGYDISNTFLLKLDEKGADAPGYVPEEARITTEAEDFNRLMDQIRLSQEVEDVCMAFYGSPYSIGEAKYGLYPANADSAERYRFFHTRMVTPEYFNVFQIKDKEENPIGPQLEKGKASIVISTELEKIFFDNRSGIGQSVIMNGDGDMDLSVAAVCQPIREDDYHVSAPCFYYVMDGEAFREISYFYRARLEMCVRMKKDYTQAEMNSFLASISERLVANNMYVYGAKKLTEQRKEKVRAHENEASIRFSLMAFMLVNVFFGIIGTFWLRTQYRKGEIGLRVAMGSTRRGLYGFLQREGVSLLLLTLPFILIFAVNIAFVDLLETSRLPLSAWRFLTVTTGSYLLMAGMICLGIWFPARAAANLPPAEALRYE